jgi:hypothetical protein
MFVKDLCWRLLLLLLLLCIQVLSYTHSDDVDMVMQMPRA